MDFQCKNVRNDERNQNLLKSVKNQSCSELPEMHFCLEVFESDEFLFSNPIFVLCLHTLRLTKRATRILANCQFKFICLYCQF